MGGLLKAAAGAAVCVMTAGAAWAQEPPRADGWVVLPIDEYRALRARAFPSTPDPAPPPVDATLTRVDYDLRVSGETVTGQARLAIDVLKQGWVSVQVPAGLLVRDARMDGRPVAFSASDGAPPRVLISRPGRSTLTLDLVMPIASGSGTEIDGAPGVRFGAVVGDAGGAACRRRSDGDRRLHRRAG